MYAEPANDRLIATHVITHIGEHGIGHGGVGRHGRPIGIVVTGRSPREIVADAEAPDAVADVDAAVGGVPQAVGVDLYLGNELRRAAIAATLGLAKRAQPLGMRNRG